MKSLYSLLLLSLLISCRKPHIGKYSDDDQYLVGKWLYTDQYKSIGGPGEWEPIKPPGQTIEFKKNGKFEGSETFFKEARRYEFVDSAQVKISPVSNSTGYIIMRYTLANNNRELQLHPYKPVICIEGCSSRFSRD
jgi:hypothetical protein